jgi:hypothetical protein
MDMNTDTRKPSVINGVGVATPCTPFTLALGLTPTIRPSTFPVAIFKGNDRPMNTRARRATAD